MQTPPPFKPSATPLFTAQHPQEPQPPPWRRSPAPLRVSSSSLQEVGPPSSSTRSCRPSRVQHEGSTNILTLKQFVIFFNFFFIFFILHFPSNFSRTKYNLKAVFNLHSTFTFIHLQSFPFLHQYRT